MALAMSLRVNYLFVFDDLYSRLTNMSIIGWDEGVLKMKLGEKAILDITR